MLLASHFQWRAQQPSSIAVTVTTYWATWIHILTHITVSDMVPLSTLMPMRGYCGLQNSQPKLNVTFWPEVRHHLKKMKIQCMTFSQGCCGRGKTRNQEVLQLVMLRSHPRERWHIYIIFFRSSHTALKQTQINSLNIANNNSRDYCDDFEVCVCCNM